MPNEQDRSGQQPRSLYEQLIYNSASTYNAYHNFIGNLSPELAAKNLFEQGSPEEITIKTKVVFEREIDIFEREAQDGKDIGLRRDENGNLIARSDVREERGISILDLASLYNLIQQPVAPDVLLGIFESFDQKIQAAREQSESQTP